MAFALTQYPSEIFTSALGGFELFAAHLNDPRAQNVETLYSDVCAGLDLTRYVNPNMIGMINVRLDERFRTPLCPSRYDA